MHLRARDVPEFAPSHEVIICPQCGERLNAREWSKYFDDKRRMHHVWKCVPCGYAFEASFATERGRRRTDRQRPLVRTWWW